MQYVPDTFNTFGDLDAPAALPQPRHVRAEPAGVLAVRSVAYESQTSQENIKKEETHDERL